MLGKNLDIVLYEVATGKQLPPLEYLNKNRLNLFAFSPDDKHLAAVEKNGTVHVWDLATSKLLRSFGMGPTGENATMLAFTPDGKRLLSALVDRRDDKVTTLVRYWDPFTGQKVRADRLPPCAKDWNGAVRAAAFTPDGKLLALARDDSSILLVDTETGKEVRTLAAVPGDGMSVIFGRDGKTLFRRLHGATVAAWDAGPGKLARYLGPPLPGQDDRDWFQSPFSCMALSPDGKTLASCGEDNCVHFVDVASGKEKPVAGHVMAIDRLQFAPNGQQLWTGAIDSTTGLWEFGTGKALPAPVLAPGRRGSRISTDGKWAIQCQPGCERLAVIDLTTGKQTTRQWPDERWPRGLKLSPDGKKAAVRWYHSDKLELYDVPSLQIRHTITVPTDETAGFDLAVFSPNSRWLAVSAGTAVVAVWDVATGKRITTVALPQDMSARNGAFTPDGRCLILDLEDGTIFLVELSTTRLRQLFSVKAVVGDRSMFGGGYVSLEYAGEAKVAVTPDGRQLVHAGPDRVVRVWDIFTGKEIASFKGHDGEILALAISPDGKFAATASTDTTVLLWALPSSTHQAKPAGLDNAFRLNFVTTTEAPSCCTSSIP
jgi:WD40 repeat protein